MEWVDAVINGIIRLYKEVDNPPLFVLLILLFSIIVFIFNFFPLFFTLLKDRKRNKKQDQRDIKQDEKTDKLINDLDFFKNSLDCIKEENTKLQKSNNDLIEILTYTFINLSETELNLIIDLILGDNSKEPNFKQYLLTSLFTFLEADITYRRNIEDLSNEVVNQFNNLVIERLKKFIIGDQIFFKNINEEDILTAEKMIRHCILNHSVIIDKEKEYIDNGKKKEDYLFLLKEDSRKLVDDLINQLIIKIKKIILEEVLPYIKNNKNVRLLIHEKEK
jgi:hypothetical protein